MNNFTFRIMMFATAFSLLNGCRQRPDTDVTSSPKYNFSSFAGTVWETKVKVAIIDVKRYTGEHALDLCPPDAFDSADPNYRPVPNGQTVAVLPVGTHLHIVSL